LPNFFLILLDQEFYIYYKIKNLQVFDSQVWTLGLKVQELKSDFRRGSKTKKWQIEAKKLCQS
jgi:hypothetical protein